MALTSALVGVGVKTALRHRARALSNEAQWGRSASAIQQAQLRWLLGRAGTTAFGAKHRFAKIRNHTKNDLVRAFRDAVPIAGFSQFKPWLDRMRLEAEPDVAWPGLVRDWAQTSGTTEGEKYVPISRDLLAHNRKAGLDAIAHAMRFGVDIAWAFRGKALVLGGSSALVEEDNGLRWGDLSGISTRLMRWPFSASILPSREIGLIGNWPTKLERMAREAMGADIRWINGMPSWALRLLEKMHDIAASHGAPFETLKEVWPNLTLFVHGGVRYEPFERRMREAWSGSPDGEDIPVRVEAYAASEAFVALQDRKGDPGLRLNLDHRVYYEFVPLEEVERNDARAFDVADVEPGQRYAIVLTNCSGLWRFLLGDVVEFDTVPPDGPPRLRIVGRVRHFMNAFGEHIIVDNIERAAVEAQRESGLTIGEFTAAPVYPDGKQQARIELAVEFADAATLTAAQRERFGSILDASLQAQNMDYAAKRRDDAGIAPPCITPLPIGTFHAWMASEGKLGGQHKCPRCANNREIIDAVHAVAHRATLMAEVKHANDIYSTS